MAKKAVPDSVDGFVISDEEKQAILALREKGVQQSGSVAINDLAQALVTAIEATRPPTKKNIFTRKKGNPWMNKDGSPKPKLKRVWFQHGMEINQNQLYSDEIEKPVRYGKYQHQY